MVKNASGVSFHAGNVFNQIPFRQRKTLLKSHSRWVNLRGWLCQRDGLLEECRRWSKGYNANNKSICQLALAVGFFEINLLLSPQSWTGLKEPNHHRWCQRTSTAIKGTNISISCSENTNIQSVIVRLRRYYVLLMSQEIWKIIFKRMSVGQRKVCVGICVGKRSFLFYFLFQHT